jgi:UDP-GlcNAc:undecaprenyl-phosphate GlcNAc-1-phosphate transferase
VPIIDTFWVITRRLAQGRAPFSADRGHFHHRLLDLGLTHRGAVLLIYAVGIVLAILSFVLSGRGQLSAFVIIVIGGGLLLYLMTRVPREALQAESYPDEEEPAPPSDSEPPNKAGAPAATADGHKRPAGTG